MFLSLRIALFTLLLSLASSPSMVLAAAERELMEKPAGLDAAGWASLQAAVRMSIGQQAKLQASDGVVGDEFGQQVALAGDTALVGAWLDDVGANADQGSAYVYTRSGNTWTQQAKLVAADGAADDLFGVSVALVGDTALVGAFLSDAGANVDQGSAYVYVRSGGTWTQQAKLLAADGAAGDWFGQHVALAGDTVLVGAFHDDIGTNSNQGSAYVYTRSGSAWTQQAKLVAADGAANNLFGSSVALEDTTALVGAADDSGGPGSAYVYIGSGSTWTQQAKLQPADGAAADQFGSSVALAGDTALIAASLDDVGANSNQGTAYVYTRSGSTWTQQAKLLASDGAAGDWFGYSVALAGNTALVGAWFDDVSTMNQGSAYVYTRSGSSWTEKEKLVTADGAGTNRFGISVALLGDTALVGALGGQGAAYVFTLSGNLTITPPSIDFSNQSVGTTSAASTVTLANTGTGSLEVTALTAAMAPFARAGGTCATTLPFTIAAGDNCTLMYTFAPTAVTAFNQTLTVTTNASGSGTIALSGAGTGTGVLGVLSATLDFGALAIPGSSTRTLTILNIGNAPLQVSSLTAVQAPFAATGGTCGALPTLINAGASCMVIYTFSPVSPLTSVQTVTITSNVGTATASLRGTGLQLIAIPSTSPLGQALLLILLAGVALVNLRQR